MPKKEIKYFDGAIQVNYIGEKDGKRFGRCWRFEVVNEHTLAIPNLRDVPQWVKDKVLTRTEYDSFYNGQASRKPKALSESVDLV